jgi:cytidine deaminase
VDRKTNEYLIQQAIEAQKRSYSPYSKYKVGAALMTKDGKVFTGCNVENAVYGEAICAERTAVVKAVSEGYQDVEVMAVVTPNGGFPCGACRQVMNEFNSNMTVIVLDENKKIQEFNLSELLPHNFGSQHLK